MCISNSHMKNEKILVQKYFCWNGQKTYTSVLWSLWSSYIHFSYFKSKQTIYQCLGGWYRPFHSQLKSTEKNLCWLFILHVLHMYYKLIYAKLIIIQTSISLTDMSKSNESPPQTIRESHFFMCNCCKK